MSIVIPEEILTATRMSEAEMLQEIAIMLFQKEKLTLAQASRFAGINRDVEDFELDINNLKEIGRL